MSFLGGASPQTPGSEGTLSILRYIQRSVTVQTHNLLGFYQNEEAVFVDQEDINHGFNRNSVVLHFNAEEAFCKDLQVLQSTKLSILPTTMILATTLLCKRYHI